MSIDLWFVTLFSRVLPFLEFVMPLSVTFVEIRIANLREPGQAVCVLDGDGLCFGLESKARNMLNPF
jgi:hypothetical protein